MRKITLGLLFATGLVFAQPQWVFHQAKLTIQQVKAIDGGFGFVVGGGHYQPYVPFLNAKLTPLNNDLSYNSSYGGVLPAENQTISAVRAIVPAGIGDEKYYVGGNFYLYGGNNTIYNLVRISGSNGNRDASFFCHVQGRIYSLAVQSDNKLIVGGAFTSVNSVTKNRIVRLNTDGTIDAAFNAYTGFDGTVRKVLLQPDGKILVAGEFTTHLPITSAPVTRFRIARLNANGTLDTSFAGLNGFNDKVHDMALQSDGKILVGGEFTTWGNHTSGSSERPTYRIKIARLNADGSLDTTFNPGAGFAKMDGTTNTGVVYTVSVTGDNDDRIFAAGDFLAYDGTARTRLCMIHPNGSINTAFDPGVGPDDPVYDHTIESANGNIIIVGQFKTYNGVIVNGIKRISSTGSPLRPASEQAVSKKDSPVGFSVFPNPAVHSLSVEFPDQKIRAITLHSIDGKQLHRSKIDDQPTCEIDISAYSPGLLILNVETADGQNITSKIVKK